MKPTRIENAGSASISAIFALALSASSALASVTITNAQIAGGKLIVAGTSSQGTGVQIDNLPVIPVDSVTRNFTYTGLYLPTNCKVLITPVGVAQPSVTALIANCSPTVLVPRGQWAPDVIYKRNDLVFWQGSTWKARATALAI